MFFHLLSSLSNYFLTSILWSCCSRNSCIHLFWHYYSLLCLVREHCLWCHSSLLLTWVCLLNCWMLCGLWSFVLRNLRLEYIVYSLSRSLSFWNCSVATRCFEMDGWRCLEVCSLLVEIVGSPLCCSCWGRLIRSEILGVVDRGHDHALVWGFLLLLLSMEPFQLYQILPYMRLDRQFFQSLLFSHFLNHHQPTMYNLYDASNAKPNLHCAVHLDEAHCSHSHSKLLNWYQPITMVASSSHPSFQLRLFAFLMMMALNSKKSSLPWGSQPLKQPTYSIPSPLIFHWFCLVSNDLGFCTLVELYRKLEHLVILALDFPSICSSVISSYNWYAFPLLCYDAPLLVNIADSIFWNRLVHLDIWPFTPNWKECFSSIWFCSMKYDFALSCRHTSILIWFWAVFQK